MFSLGLVYLIAAALVVLKLYAFIDCLRRPALAFPATGKLTKPIWAGITGVSVVLQFLTSAIGLLSIAGTVAAIVYLVDVKPAVSGTSQ